MDTGNDAATRLMRRRRSMGWSIVLVLALAMLLPATAYVVHFTTGAAHAQQPVQQPAPPAEAPPPIDPAAPPVEAEPAPRAWDPAGPNPRSETWRHARADGAGYVAASGPYTVNTLINNSGQNWRQLRMGPVHNIGGWFLVLVPLAILAFFLIKGRVPIEGGRAGVTIKRWSLFDRTLHWFTAITFIILAITGLSLLFGRTVLIPLFGLAGNAAWANIAMNVHNYVGPVFSIGVLVMIVKFMALNIPRRHDLEWFKRGGGIVGDDHPPAGFLNGGEKIWFWGGVFFLGLVVIVSGFVLDFPQFGQSRSTMSAAHLFHAVAAVAWICFAMGHIYIGTLGTEGALEGMTTGEVDVNWARQHHDLWLEDLQREGGVPPPPRAPTPPPGQPEPDIR